MQQEEDARLTWLYNQVPVALLNCSVKCNIYQTGSRVYGTATDTSDYDFFVIISDAHYKMLNAIPPCESWQQQYAGKTTSEEYQCLYFGNVNLNIYSAKQFDAHLQKNWLQAIACLCLPKQFVWKCDFAFEYAVNFRKLGMSVIGEAGKHYEMARRKWHEGVHAAKKLIVHSIRDFLYGMQVAQKNKIDDFGAANSFYYEIMALTDTSFEYYDKRYHDYYEKLKMQFNAMVLKTSKSNKQAYYDNTCHTMALLEAHGLECGLSLLHQMYGLVVTHVQQLVHVTSAPDCLTCHTPVIECTGMVIDTQLSLLCYPPKRLLEYNMHDAPDVDWPSVILTPHHVGVWVTLFYATNTWRICTEKSLSCNEPFLNSSITVDTQFWNLWNFYKYSIPIDSSLCYTFHLTEKDLYFIGARNLTSKAEVCNLIETASLYNWHLAPQIEVPCTCFEHVCELAYAMDARTSAGILIQDKNMIRTLVPAPQHFAYMQLQYPYSKHAIIAMQELIRSNPTVVYPEIFNNYPLYLHLQQEYLANCTLLQQIWDQLEPITNSKAYATQLDAGCKALPTRFKSVNVMKLFHFMKQRLPGVKSIVQGLRYKRLKDVAPLFCDK